MDFGSSRYAYADRITNAVNPAYSDSDANCKCNIHTNVDGDGNIHAYTNSYSYAYGYSYRNVNNDSDCYCHSYSDRNGYSNASAESNANGNVHFYSKTLPDSKRYPATKVAANSAAETLGLACVTEGLSRLNTQHSMRS